MALVDMKLPKCDCCGAIGLPRPGPARDDPRGLRPDGSGKRNHDRCGTCKGDWDRDYVPEVETPEAMEVREQMSNMLDILYSPVIEKILSNPENQDTLRTFLLPKPEIDAGSRSFAEQLRSRVGDITGATSRRCKHGLIGCTICNPKEAA